MNENLVVRRAFGDYETMNAKRGTNFQAYLDTVGHLHIIPGEKWYTIYLRDMQEGTVIHFAYKEGEEPDKWPSKPEKVPFLDCWYVDYGHGWDIEFEVK